MLNACLKSEKKVGVVQLGHRWFGLISSMNEGTTDCTYLRVVCHAIARVRVRVRWCACVSLVAR
jgi:hypothetical protein